MIPPAPTFTEKDIIDLSSKVYIPLYATRNTVYIITCATSGPGLELAKILYTLHATVYIGTRLLSSFEDTHRTITSKAPTSQGTLKPFIADLADLHTVKLAAESFLKENYRLDVLFLEGGVDRDSKDAAFALRANCLAPFLLTHLLYPLMHRTTTHFCHINTSIRIVYACSLLTVSTPQGGVQLVPGKEEEIWNPKQLVGVEGYMQSKAGVYFLAYEFALRHKDVEKVDEHGVRSRNTAGVLHVCVNQGAGKAALPEALQGILGRVGKRARYGAYTELFAGVAPGVEDGDFIVPWGRKGSVPEHVQASMKEGKGKSVSARFYEWCEAQVRPFL
ncbi:short-chain alcohol dehydrogenase [Didymosphaeria variabile]|uniref:Short-chain alcohol dehydrogenase n=1 Tax=Didymosphaeria variabile TaxID=1932322 RepID=A0A9W8XY77_9PLEO|nr:short-chain alcohol dehydrogenase [Didymosphaeria variabile]KAJ4360765.1 short-chain alcohol dehydrogenase [Didymosphaeria variabile]